MKLLKRYPTLAATLVVGWLASPQPAMACAACFGKSDSALAKGMNWGIFTLLVVVGGVLSGFVCFGVYLAKKSAMYADKVPGASPVITKKV